MHDLVIPEGWTGIANNAFQDCYALNKVDFPASLVTIGEYAFYNCKNFEYVDLKKCTKVTEIQKYAFGLSNAATGTVGMGSKVLNLPPNVVNIREGAFLHHSALVLWIPKHVDRIEALAFQDYGGSNPMSDIFFTGTTAPSYVDKDAFTENTYSANGGTVNFADVSTDGTADRDVYKAGTSGYCTIMHFPEGCDAQYIDMTRVYDSRGRKEKGATPSGEGTTQNLSYVPDGYELYKTAKGSYPSYTPIHGGYPDKTLGEELVWPSEGQMQGAYRMAREGYHWDGTPMNAVEQNKIGLYKFVLGWGDCPSDEIKGYENDKWYTICLPYDMSVDQVKATFGSQTQVCRINNVERVESGVDMGIQLYFQRSVMSATGGYDSAVGKNKNATSGIVAYYPYMIKPSGNDATNNSYNDADGTLVRTFPEYQENYYAGAIHRDEMTVGGKTYTFVGTHSKTNLQQYSYFLGRQTTTGTHRFFFYTGTTDQGADRWKAFTAVVQAGDGEDDFNKFFSKGTATGGSIVKMESWFGDDAEDAPTAVEDVDARAPKTAGNKVFTLSGRYAGTSLDGLPKGIYVVGGKKYIVR
ncbi:MAG: leucine-rich repeat domain-containing protein [Bacteroidaceae bacterium]|nr:leucine-rich repeat domain-containing protein [Bacteroidaceae bacterium]